jgi:uncharacterized protein
MKINGSLDVPDEAIGAFCRKWKITRIELFGSALRDDFRPDSDVDLLVAFEEGARVTLFDLVEMQEEISGIVGRPVDLVDRAGIEQSRNPFRRHRILSSAQVVYKVA